MGAIRDFLFPSVAPSKSSDVEAALTPVQIQDAVYSVLQTSTTATRRLAMSVPSVARARNIICGTIGSLPLEQYNKLTGAHIEAPRVIHQPDPRVPGSLIYTWLAEDIWLYGVGYGQIIDQYAVTDGGKIRGWTRISPDRVTVQTNATNTEIVSYAVDGIPVPSQGVGSLVRFDGFDEGFLHRAGKTVNAAVYLENAAVNYAKEPVPSLILKSTGTNLPAERVASLLSAWRNARQSRSTAF